MKTFINEMYAKDMRKLVFDGNLACGESAGKTCVTLSISVVCFVLGCDIKFIFE